LKLGQTPGSILFCLQKLIHSFVTLLGDDYPAIPKRWQTSDVVPKPHGSDFV